MRDLYRDIHVMTRDLGLHGSIKETAFLSLPLARKHRNAFELKIELFFRAFINTDCTKIHSNFIVFTVLDSFLWYIFALIQIFLILPLINIHNSKGTRPDTYMYPVFVITSFTYLYYGCKLKARNTGDFRWLELRSLEVLDLSKYNCGPVCLLYKAKQIWWYDLYSPMSFDKLWS